MTFRKLKIKMIPWLAVFGLVVLVMFFYRGYVYAMRNKDNNNGNDRWKSVWYNILHEFQYFFNT